ncbi:MAG: HAMP domain-containing protein [Rhodospirillales bacterium]|nr:MAG: HAMP domain-containing protein [Rhodospirillales bacterium]
MRRLIPQSLFGRTIAVLIVGLIVTHFASSAIHYSDRGEALTMVGGGIVAERIATMVRLLEKAPPERRPWLVHAASRPGFRLSWDSSAALPADGTVGLRERLMATMLALSLGEAGAQDVRVGVAEAVPGSAGESGMMHGPAPRRTGQQGMGAMMRYHMQMMETEYGAAGSTLRVSVKLSDESWLNLATFAPPEPPFWSGRLVLSLIVMAVSVALLSAWAVRRMTGPLEEIAAAADRLGRDMQAPPLSEKGASEVRRAAHAFNRMQQRLRSLLDGRMRMLAAISHDLRTPITRLRLRAELIEDDEQREKTLADLAEMEKMITSTLAFARDDAQTEARETVDLSSLVQSVCDDLSDAGRDCTFEAAPPTPYLCRPLALRRALTNLAENAVAYGARARAALVQTDNRIIVRVDDDGPGIPEAELAQVFEPFYRLERSRSRETGGTGIGLCVVQSVAQAHGGEVRLSNREEGGLRAELILPL